MYLEQFFKDYSDSKVKKEIADYLKKRAYYTQIINNLLVLKTKGFSSITKTLNAHQDFDDTHFQIDPWQELKSEIKNSKVNNKLRCAIIPDIFTYTPTDKTFIFNIELHNLNSFPESHNIFHNCENNNSAYLLLSSRISDNEEQKKIQKYVETFCTTLSLGFLNLIGGIDFSDLHLTEIPLPIKDMVNLKIILLQKNTLTQLPWWFLELKNLEIIDIAYNNIGSLENIPTNNLRILYAENNNIEHIDHFKAPHITILYLKNNSSLCTNSKLLENCPKLKELTLPPNNHEDLSDQAKKNNFSFTSTNELLELEKQEN